MSGELSKLQAPKGANRTRRIKGRGISAGQGKTAGRGTKGQKARKSGPVRLGFEGGQMPLQRRLPKRGFKNKFADMWAEVRLSDLNMFDGTVTIDHTLLKTHGLAKGGKWDGVKILANGEITKALTVRVNRISKVAKEKIEKAGGKVELIADRVKWQRANTRAQKRAAKKKAV
jgi:large subunit ribosomal protein L15